MLKWDPTINVGTLLGAGIILLPLLRGLWYINKMSNKVDEMWNWFEKNVERRLIVGDDASD